MYSSIGQVAVFVIAVMLRGLVLALIWEWFVVPLGVPPVRLWQAIGLSVLLALMTSGLSVSITRFEQKFDRLYKKFDEADWKEWKKDQKPAGAVIMLLMPTMFLIFGYIYHVLDVGHL